MSADSGDVAAVPRVHLDAASGLPLHPRAREVWLEAQDAGWADPLRAHAEGRLARDLLETARAATAEALGCEPDEVSFTPSGTAACHAGVLGLRRGRGRVGATVVHSSVEHTAVLRAASWSLAGPRPDVAMPSATVSVGVDAFGSIDLGAWRSAVARGGVAAACLQAASPEVGTVQPVAEALDACREQSVPLFVDACAAIGWADLPPGDVVAASAHKWGGPPGVGVLVVRRGVAWRAPGPSDDRELAVAGYVDIASALAASAALQAVEAERPVRAEAMRRMTAELRREIVATIADVHVAGHAERRLPHIVSFSCLHLDGESLVAALDRAGFAVTTGSARSDDPSGGPSHVLAAMGVLTDGNVQVAISAQTTPEDLWRFVDTTATLVPRLRSEAGLAASAASALADAPGSGRHRGAAD